MTAACSIGMTKSDIDQVILKLRKCFHEFNKQKNKRLHINPALQPQP
jgi:hypothetical protein